MIVVTLTVMVSGDGSDVDGEGGVRGDARW